MPRHTANDFDPAVLKLFDQFVHGIIDRRGFLAGAGKYAAGGVSATMLLSTRIIRCFNCSAGVYSFENSLYMAS